MKNTRLPSLHETKIWPSYQCTKNTFGFSEIGFFGNLETAAGIKPPTIFESLEYPEVQ